MRCDFFYQVTGNHLLIWESHLSIFQERGVNEADEKILPLGVLWGLLIPWSKNHNCCNFTNHQQEMEKVLRRLPCAMA